MLSISIVTYNSADVIAECLQAITEACKDIDYEVTVVDNASTDEIRSVVPGDFPNVKLVVNDQNIGFGSGHNVGFAHSTGDYFAIINPDLVVQPDMFTTLIDYLENNPVVGIVGPCMYDGDGVLGITARPEYTLEQVLITRIGNPRENMKAAFGDYVELVKTATEPLEAGWLVGACLLTRRDVYERINGFDDDFFLFSEDADICDRIRKAEWNVMFHPGTGATHYTSTSVRKEKLITLLHFRLSPMIYFRKRGEHAIVRTLKTRFVLNLIPKIIKRLPRRSTFADAKMYWTVLYKILRF